MIEPPTLTKPRKLKYVAVTFPSFIFIGYMCCQFEAVCGRGFGTLTAPCWHGISEDLPSYPSLALTVYKYIVLAIWAPIAGVLDKQ